MMKISDAKLYTLRDNGLTNTQIARKCKICVATVYNRIGKQPSETTALARKRGGLKNHLNKVTRTQTAKVLESAKDRDKIVIVRSEKIEQRDRLLAMIAELNETIGILDTKIANDMDLKAVAGL